MSGGIDTSFPKVFYDAFGLFDKPKQPELNIPKVEAPAPPAPSRKQDTGAMVKVGDAGGSDRLSGGGTGGVRRKSGSSLGNLGRGGLSI